MMTATDKVSDGPIGARFGDNAQELEPNEYAQLKRLVQDAGLLEKNPGHYAVKLAVNLGFLALSVAVLTSVDSFLDTNA